MVNSVTGSSSSTPPPSGTRSFQEEVLRSGLRDESASSNNNVTFGEGESPITSNTNKHRLMLEQGLLSSGGVEGLPQDVLNSVGQYAEIDGLLLEGVVPSTPTMDIRMETTSSVAATGPASTSSHRSMLSNYSGSSSDNELDDGLVRENGNELVTSSSQISTGSASVPSSLPNRAMRVQAQLVHQRRLQNTAKASGSRSSPPSMSSHTIVGKEELQGMMESMTTRIDKAFQEIMTQQRKDFDRVFQQVQSESQKHTTIESRLHAQLLLQSESMVAMELKLLRLEAKMQQKDQTRSRFSLHPVIETRHRDDEDCLSLEEEDDVPARTTHVLSSGASLVSAVTATSGLEDGALLGDDEEQEEEEPNAHIFEAPPVPENDDHSSSTAPSNVLYSRQLSDSILLNPIPNMQPQSGVSITGESTRAIRPAPVDDASSLATSVTTSTLPSTVVTASNPNAARTSSLHRGRSSEMEVILPRDAPRSRSQSPLTVPSMATASIVPSIASTVLTTNAIASSREFRARRTVSSLASQSDSTRPTLLTNRVVSFVADAPQAANDTMDTGSMADTLTLPDEIDNMSDIVDAFASSSNRWREEYEARLEAIQKRFSRD